MAATISARALLQQEVQELSEQLEDVSRRLGAKRRALAALDEIESSANGHRPSLNFIRPDDFTNMEIGPAIEKYLTKLEGQYPQDFDRRKIPPQHLYRDIKPALLKGGCRLNKGDKSRDDRNIKIAVRMNSREDDAFVYDGDSETVTLRSWYSSKQPHS